MSYAKAKVNFQSRIQAYKMMIAGLGAFRALFFSLCNSFQRHRDFRANINNQLIWIRSNTDDLYVVSSVLDGSEYIGISNDFLTPSNSNLIIDAGSHIGSSAILLSQKFPRHKVVCIEPEKDNFRLLQRNTLGISNVILLNSALGSNSLLSKTASVYNRAEASGYTILPTKDAQIVNEIGIVSLKSIMTTFNQNEIAFLKLDIEGSEVMLFEDEESLAFHIFSLLVEFHDRIHPESSRIVKRFFESSHDVVSVNGEKMLFRRKSVIKL